MRDRTNYVSRNRRVGERWARCRTSPSTTSRSPPPGCGRSICATQLQLLAPRRSKLDGKVVKADAAGQVTGSWTPDGQKWFVEAAVPITAGKHVLRLENDGPFPHIDKIALGLRKRSPRGAR